MSHDQVAARAQRPVRSFVRREGRMTPAQRRALAELWPRYGLDASGPALDLARVFGRAGAVHLEIGFGNGDALLALAQAYPDRDYLGVEVHRPGVGRALHRADAAGLSNLRVFCADANEVLRARIPPNSLDAIYVWFPDPWPKKRHHKRRLVNAAFAALARERLVVGGRLHIATDWADYAHAIVAALSGVPGLRNAAVPGPFLPAPGPRPVTRFERRGQALGHAVFDLVFERTG